MPLHEQTVTVDGLLEEAAWRSAPAGGFLQQRPLPGAPALAESSVWIAYDLNNLYIAAALYDPDPDLIQGDEKHRDASLERSDTFSILIDTYHDHQSGFFFETNILSAMSDAIVSREGGEVNRAWNGLWEAASRRTENGWSVEIRIPFKTLRYRSGKEQTWGFQFRRRAVHLKEVSFWAPLSPEQLFFELSRAGHAYGIEAPPQASPFSIKPYVKGTYQRKNDPEEGWNVDHDAGLDLRYRLRTNLVLDLTFNTDFAETEADRFQYNLTRFPLFFPEKREFFLEGRSFFDFGLAGRAQPFFSRRIGLANQTPVPILRGGKMTGKIGPYGLGLLFVETRKQREIPAERFRVLRMTRDLGTRSNIGLVATERAGSGAERERTAGFDATIAPHPNLVANAFWLRSGGKKNESDGEAGFGQLYWRDPLLRIFIRHLRVDERFVPALGFVEQADLKETEGSIDIRPQPASGPVREFGFKGDMVYRTDTGGDFLYRSNYWRAQADFKSGDFLLVSRDPQAERIPADFEIRPGITIPAGKYRYEQQNILLSSDPRRLLSGSVTLGWGGFYEGRKTTLDFNITAAPAGGVKIGMGWGRDAVHLPQGNFIAQVIEGDVEWAITNRLFLQGLLQLNREDRTLAANFRLAWEYRPGSHLLIVANPSRQREGDSVLFLFKLTRLWEPAI